MKNSFSLKVLPWVVGAFSLGVGAQAQTATKTYTADNSTNLANPERGFHHTIYPAYTAPPTPTRALTDADCQYAKDRNWTLVHMRYVIYDYRTQDLPASFLQRLADDCAVARRNGMKLIPNWAYNYGGGEYNGQSDTETRYMLRHISQLRPYFRNNADVLAFVEVGFMGKWGEEHGSTNNLYRNGDHSYLNANSTAVWDSLLKVIPTSRMINTRYPYYKRQYINPTSSIDPQDPDSAPALTQETAFYDRNPVPATRIGHHNNSFLGNQIDFATYLYWDNAELIERHKVWLSQDTRYVVQRGEPFGGLEQPLAAEATLNEFRRMHWDSFSGTFDDGSATPQYYDAWRNAGIYDDIERNLGYRFQLVNATAPAAAQAGQAVHLEFKVANAGWGKAYNRRPAYIDLQQVGGSRRVRLALDQGPRDNDPRFWSPGTTTTAKLDATLPADLPAGSYRAWLHLPDAAPSLANDSRYAVRLANTDVTWDANTGGNDLGLNIQVGGGTATTQLITNGVYKLVSQVSVNGTPLRVLDVDGGIDKDGQNVWLYRDNGSDAQRWQFTHVGNNVYKITSQVGSKTRVLDADNGGRNNFSNVFLWEDWGGANQRWKVEATGNGYYKLTTQASANEATKYCLDVDGGINTDRTNVQLYQNNDLAPQRWRIEAIAATAARLSAGATQSQTQRAVAADLISFWPNPALGGAITMAIQTQQGQALNITVRTLQGRFVGQFRRTVPAGSAQFNLPLGPLAPGLYLVSTVVDGQPCTRKLVVQ